MLAGRPPSFKINNRMQAKAKKEEIAKLEARIRQLESEVEEANQETKQIVKERNDFAK